MKIKYYHLLLMGLFILVLASRLFLAFQTPNFSYDAYFNLKQVEHIQQTGLPLYHDDLSYGGRTYYFPPFFHYLLTFFNLFLPLDLVGKIIPNLLISFLMIIVFLIAKQITKRDDAALFSAFISGFIPVLFAQTINTVSVLTLVIPLIFLAMYCLMNLQKKNFLYAYLAIILILSLTHASAFFLIFGLVLFLIISEVEIIKRNRAETELILFSAFIFIWIQVWFYKKAILVNGISVIWKNIPAQMMASYFSEITILGTITQIGWLPFFYGIFLIFKYVLKEKNKYIYMYISLALPVIILLWLKWIEPTLGLLFLGVTLAILFSEFYKISFDYIKRTKLPSIRYIFVMVLTLTFLLTSVWPAVTEARCQLNETVPQVEVEALKWLSTQDQKAMVLATGEEGYIINYLAKQKNVLDHSFLFTEKAAEILSEVEKIYTTSSRIEAIELLNKYKVDYILITPQVKKDYQIKTIFFKDEVCIKKVYRGEVEIYKNDCELKTLTI